MLVSTNPDFYLTVLEVRSLKWVDRLAFLLEAQGRGLFLAFLQLLKTAYIAWLVMLPPAKPFQVILTFPMPAVTPVPFSSTFRVFVVTSISLDNPE